MATEPARLVLITPLEFRPEEFARQLADALQAADVAAVILDTSHEDPAVIRHAAQVLCPIAQERGAAFLIRDNPGLVREVGADGIHVTTGGASVRDAMTSFKPDLIVGAGDTTTRHAAMLLGEHQPDYVLLGRLEEEEDIPATVTLVEWWTDLFQIPCVALCTGDWSTTAEAVTAGADFIALRDLVWADPAGAADAVLRAATIAAQKSEVAA